MNSKDCVVVFLLLGIYTLLVRTVPAHGAWCYVRNGIPHGSRSCFDRAKLESCLFDLYDNPQMEKE